ncbi:MAG: glycosyltransferase family 1 protein, partial [Candidatus Pacearchaeota archaeon]
MASSRTINIGVDAILPNVADPNYTGGLNAFAHGLLSGFQKIKEQRFTIFCSQYNYKMFEKYKNSNNFNVVIVPLRKDVISKVLKFTSAMIIRNIRIWVNVINYIMKDVKKAVDNNCQVLYCPYTILSAYNYSVPTFLSMHDIQHIHFPHFFSRTELLWRNMHFNSSARYANFFQASTNLIKNELMKYFKIAPERIVVITGGVDIEKFEKSGKTDVKSKYKLPEKFIFYPAQLWPHKNHITILKAIKKLEIEEKKKFPLVLTGAAFSAYKDIMKFIKENNMTYVRYLGKVDFEDLVSLYKNSHIVLSAALYESKSLPIYEAAACGVPII